MSEVPLYSRSNGPKRARRGPASRAKTQGVCLLFTVRRERADLSVTQSTTAPDPESREQPAICLHLAGYLAAVCVEAHRLFPRYPRLLPAFLVQLAHLHTYMTCVVQEDIHAYMACVV